MILIHEAGHIIAVYALGVRIKRGRRFFGISLRLDGTERISYGKEAIIYASGAIFNLLSLLIPRMGETFYAYSVGAAVFNLLPLSGSDGEGLVYAVGAGLLTPDAAAKLTRVLGRIFLILVWLFAVSVNLTGGGSFALLIAVTAVLLSDIR